MRDAPLSILAVFAHPDDEIGSGSTLARYTSAGVLANLACASRGEAATIYCEDCATPANLAEVRTRELECSCRHLGLAELRWLDWPDGGIAKRPREAAVRQVAALIRELQPDVILTHPENGLYPHPDHLAVWEITRAAFDAAADPAAYPGIGGAAWAAARLFTRAIPQSYFDAAPDFAAARIELNGRLLPFMPTPDGDVDVTMQVAPWVAQRNAAWECHRSQHNPDGAFSKLPEAVRQAMWENDHYLLAASRAALPPGSKHDLLAGLDAWPGTHEAADTAAGDERAALAASLATRRAYLVLYGEYAAASSSAPDFQAFLTGWPEAEQEMLYILARGLRRTDGTPGTVAADQRVLAQGRGCRTARARTQFLLVAARHAVARFGELAARAAPSASLPPEEGDPPEKGDRGRSGDEQVETWRELLGPAQERLDAVTRFAEAGG